MESPSSMYYHLIQNDQNHRNLLANEPGWNRSILMTGREVIDADDQAMAAHNAQRDTVLRLDVI